MTNMEQWSPTFSPLQLGDPFSKCTGTGGPFFKVAWGSVFYDACGPEEHFLKNGACGLGEYFLKCAQRG